MSNKIKFKKGAVMRTLTIIHKHKALLLSFVRSAFQLNHVNALSIFCLIKQPLTSSGISCAMLASPHKDSKFWSNPSKYLRETAFDKETGSRPINISSTFHTFALRFSLLPSGPARISSGHSSSMNFPRGSQSPRILTLSPFS